MNIICTICARGGSKGVKNKNVRELMGKPLIVHSILQAQETKLFTTISVSSDSEEILKTALHWGVDYAIKRPMEMATDTAAKLPVIQHCVIETEKLSGQTADIIVDLDATSPLRFAEDIDNAVKLLLEKQVSNVITGAPARRSPYFNLVELDANGNAMLSKSLQKQIVRRQDSPKCYDMNASIYVWQREALLNNKSIFNKDTLLYVMPEARSIDIDSELDFEFVEFIMRSRNI
ncbi:MAG: acylneuraminate cytidylyltransferase family protein [Bacillota bacterium]